MKTIAMWVVAGSIIASSLAAVSAHDVMPAQAASSTAAIRPADFSSSEKDIVVGKTVYLRSSKTLIGRIVAVEANHRFPPSFPKSPATGVRIQHANGPLDWIPLDGFLKIYVVAATAPARP